MTDVKVVSRLETFLARIFGKKERYENEYFTLTIHYWMGKLYITSLTDKGED